MKLTAAMRETIRLARDKAARERLRLYDVDTLGRRKHGGGEHRLKFHT